MLGYACAFVFFCLLVQHSSCVSYLAKSNIMILLLLVRTGYVEANNATSPGKQNPRLRDWDPAESVSKKQRTGWVAWPDSLSGPILEQVR